jgi:hypothetical protein
VISSRVKQHGQAKKDGSAAKDKYEDDNEDDEDKVGNGNGNNNDDNNEDCVAHNIKEIMTEIEGIVVEELIKKQYERLSKDRKVLHLFISLCMHLKGIFRLDSLRYAKSNT